MEISFKLDWEINKNKVKVLFRPKTVELKYDGKQVDKLDLYSKVDVDGCTWTLDKRMVVVTFEKMDAGVAWPRITDDA